jgi:beta-lactamase regulating signal transducer with metallopeptidase domain
MSAILASLNAFSAVGLIAVLNTLWLAFGVAGVVWLSLRLMPRVNAATRHAVWWAVLALVVILPLAALLLRSARPAPPPTQTDKPVQTRALSPSAAWPHPVARAQAPAPRPTSALLHASYSGPAQKPGIRIPIEFHTENWQSILLLLWIASSCILLARLVLSYLHLRGMRNRAWRPSPQVALRFEQRLRESRTLRNPVLLVSDEVVSPLVAGFAHPVIILPALLLDEISASELDDVLLHELAHVARRDDWTNLTARLVAAAFVLHPVAAWALRRIEREREIACDDWVVAATGSAYRYATTLARLMEFCCKQRRELLATGMAHRSSNVRQRVEILLQPRHNISAGASLPRVGFCIAACLALLCFALRMPWWIALANDSSVAVAHTPSTPQSPVSGPPIAPSPESSVIPAAPLVTALSPERPAQSPAVPAASADQDRTWRHGWKLTRESSSSSKVQLSLINRDDNGNDRMNTQDVPLSNLPGLSLSMLDHDGPIKFVYVRDAGRILCEGSVSGGRASGPFTVELNPSFVSALEKIGYAAPRDEDAFSLVTSDVTLAYAQAVRDTGVTTSISGLIDLRDHGVRPDYLKAINEEDPSLSIEAIDSLYDHGVKPDYYKSMKTAAPQLSIEQIDSLFDHGVKPDSYKGFASVSPKLSIDEINSLCDHGVKPEYYQSMKTVDPNLSIEQIDSLFDHGVKPDSYKGFASVSPKLSIEQINSLYDHGVKPDSYQGFVSADRKLSIEQINRLFGHGVEPEFYQGIKATDSTISIEDINRLRDHGVPPEYLKEIRALPDGFSIADISELRDHGITANYIRNLHDMGMKNLTADQIVHLREGN